MLLEPNFKPYAIPPVLWICAFVLAKRFPGLLQTLSMRFLSDEDSLTLTNLSTNPCGSLSSAGPSSAWSTTPSAASSGNAWIHLLRSPLQLLRLCASLLHCLGRAGKLGFGNQPCRRVFAVTSTSMASLLIHTNRWDLLNSIIVYAYTLSIGKKQFQRHEALTDVLGGFLGATLTNIFLHLRVPSFSPSKRHEPPRLGLLGGRPFLLSIGSALIVILATLFPFHSFPTYFFSILSRPSPDAAEGGVEDNPSMSSSATSTAPSAATITSPRPTTPSAGTAFSHRTTPYAVTYVCGGETFSYALSGFRFIYRSDVVQLRGAVWGYWIDWLHNYSSDMRAPWWLSGFATDLLGSDEPGGTISTPRAAFFTSTTSQDLHHMNALAFIAGAGVGWVAKVIPKLSIVNAFIGLFYEVPPPPIDIPNGLLDSILTDLSIIRVYKRHSCFPPSVATNSHLDEHSGTKTNSRASSIAISPEHSCEAFEVYVDIPIPPECFCPITRNIMRDPVTTVDGFTYEREAIAEWLNHRISSPMTNLPLKDVTLVWNPQVYKKLQEVVAAYNDAVREK